MKLSKQTILLAEITNYSVKGFTSALGKGSGVTKSLWPVRFKVTKAFNPSDFARNIIKRTKLEDGDIIVVPSKVVSTIEKRFVLGLTIENYRKCTSDLKFARSNLKMLNGGPITPKELVGLDKIDPKKGIGIRYPENPNYSAHTIASAIFSLTGISVDVVITDSDSGGVKGIKLIGCPTVITTPIGATKGLRLFYCMRVATAGEIIWNNVKNIPCIVVNPYQVNKLRKEMGALRYDGFLDADKEQDVISIMKK